MAAKLRARCYRCSPQTEFCLFCYLSAQQPEVVFHSLRQREDAGLWEFLCCFSSPPSTPQGFEKPPAHLSTQDAWVLFSHLIPLGYNSRSSHAGWAPIIRLGPLPSVALGSGHGCRPPAVSYPHSWVWPFHFHPIWSICLNCKGYSLQG